MKIQLTFLALMFFTACKASRFAAVANTRTGPWEHPMTLENGPQSGTVDSTLPCVALVENPDARTDDTKSSFEYLSKHQGNSSTAVIVGHGTSGVLCTGNGKDCTDQALNVMNNGNVIAWSAYAGDLKGKGFTTLRILSCGVGEGVVGAIFLRAVSDATGCDVLAPTAAVYCRNNAVELDTTAVWQIARAGGVTPTPITPKVSFAPPTSAALTIDGKTVMVPWAARTSTTFSLLESFDGGKFTPLSQPLADRLTAMIDFEHPFSRAGTPLAIETGLVELRFELPGQTIDKTFVILGDQIVRDSENSTIFYRTSTQFLEAIAGLRR